MATLSPSALDAFFQALAQRVPCSVRLIITGGAAALLLGSVRPTRDIDFGVVLTAAAGDRDRHWPEVETAIAAAAQAAQVIVQYSADIDRWSSIAMPGYQHHTRSYRRFGRVSVHLLEPAYWAVQKLTRYLDTDIADLQAVLRTQEVHPHQLARLCGRALRSSPRSTALFSFRQHIEDFFRTHGTAVWGGDFDAEAAVRSFHRAARIR